MGDKVSKIKKGIQKNLVIKVEFNPQENKKDKISGQEIIDLLSTLITTCNKTVTHFHITTPELTDTVAKNMEVLLKTYTSASTERMEGTLSLGLKDVDFSSVGINHIFNSLEKCDIIGDLILHGSYKPLEKTNIETLAKVLKTNQTLKRLDIGGFAVNREITQMFAKVMASQKTVIHLILFKWELKPEDITLLLDGSVFEYIDLSDCDLTDAHVKALADCLKKNTTLKKIVLEENKITDKGVQYLIDELEQNKITNVTSIVLDKNPGINNEEMLPKLAEILEKLSDQRRLLVRDDKKQEKKPEEKKQDIQQETEQVKTRVASKIIEGQKVDVKKEDFLEFL